MASDSQEPNSMDPNSLTREALLLLNSKSTDIDDARALFNVDLEYFKARLLQENIFVWESSMLGGPVRIHKGDNYDINICFKKLRLAFPVKSTCPFKEVLSIIDREADLSPGSYKLTYKHPSEGDVLVQTDRDWHFAVEFFRGKGFFTCLDLNSDEHPSDEHASDVPINLSHNWMEQVPVSSKEPVLSTKDTKPNSMDPNSLTREALLLLKSKSTDIDDARALFNVDLEYFKARLLQENIFVWESSMFGGPIRIHMGDSYDIIITFKKLHLAFAVRSTCMFKEVLSIIDMQADLSPASYKLAYKHPSEGDFLVQTDRDWHFAVESHRGKGSFMYLDLNTSHASKVPFVHINLSPNWMEQLAASSKEPVLATKDTKPKSMGPSSYIHRHQSQLIRELNDGSMTFEHARSFFNVDLKDFKEFMLEESIFVWNEPGVGPVRIHGGDYVLHIFIKKFRKSYDVASTVPFKEVISMIERDLGLSPGSYNLTYKPPSCNVNVVITANSTWHDAVRFSRKPDFNMYLDMKKTYCRVNKKCKKSN